jgi:hypothetical protein
VLALQNRQAARETVEADHRAPNTAPGTANGSTQVSIVTGSDKTWGNWTIQFSPSAKMAAAAAYAVGIASNAPRTADHLGRERSRVDALSAPNTPFPT